MKSHFILNRVKLLALLLGASAILIYLPALNLGFVNWDDNQYVYENRNILSLNCRFFQWAFTTFQVGNWHPLTWLSYGIDYYLWGMRPAGFHATNIVLHGVNTGLVTILTALLISAAKNAEPREGSGSGLSDRGMITAAAVTGILFGLHPIHVESVAWISERKDVLYSFFFLAGILAYLRYARDLCDGFAGSSFFQGRSSRFYFMALLFFVLSLLSKPMAVTFPLVLLILDWYPLGRFAHGERRSALLLEKLPLFLLSFFSAVVTMASNKSGNAMSSLAESPLTHRLFIGTQALVMYLWKMLIPLNLLPIYPYPDDISLLSVKYFVFLGVVAGIAISCVVFFRMKKGRYWISAWSYYFITLLPVLGFIEVGMQSMADRYTYLPSLGPFLLIGLGTGLVFERKRESNSGTSAERYVILMLLGVLALSLSYLTTQQTMIWKDGFSLWNYIIEKEPEAVDTAYNNRGNLFLKHGRPDKALVDFNAALALRPRYIPYYVHRAEAYNRLGDDEKMLSDLTTVVTLSPDYVLGYLYRALLYNRRGDHDKALTDLTTAVTVKPDYAPGYFHRGNTYNVIGQYEKAIADFSKAITLNSDNAYGYFNRGTTYYRMKKFDRAIDDFSKAISLDTRFADAYGERGVAYIALARYDEAIKDCSTAILINPGRPEFYLKRGLALKKLGRLEEGERDMKEAKKLSNEILDQKRQVSTSK